MQLIENTGYFLRPELECSVYYWCTHSGVVTRRSEFMKLIKLIVCLLIVFFAASASAQFYKYVDEEGNTRFTDDINQVPPDQRKKIQSYEESFSETPAVEENSTQEAPQASPEQADSPDTASESQSENLQDARKRLDDYKKEIDNEYNELIKEKQRLAEEKEKAVTREQVIDYNKKVDDLNERVKAYQIKGKDYEAQVDAYNDRIAQENAARKQTQNE